MWDCEYEHGSGDHGQERPEPNSRFRSFRSRQPAENKRGEQGNLLSGRYGVEAEASTKCRRMAAMESVAITVDLRWIRSDGGSWLSLGSALFFGPLEDGCSEAVLIEGRFRAIAAGTPAFPLILDTPPSIPV